MFSLQFDIPNGLYSLSSFSDLQIILKFNVNVTDLGYFWSNVENMSLEVITDQIWIILWKYEWEVTT